MKSTVGSEPKIDIEKLKAELREKKSLPIRVVTGSMEPVIMTGEVLTLGEITEPLRLFDIIVYWNGSLLICHFVWRVNRQANAKGERWVVTRSMQSRWEDFPVLDTQILGRVMGREIPFMRRLFIALGALLRK